MNSLSKGMCVIVGLVAVLWTGTQLFRGESRRDQIPFEMRQSGDDKTLRTFQQGMAVLHNRLAQVENSQSNLARLQDRLAQLEDVQQDLQAELNTTPLQDTHLAHGEEIDGSTVESEAPEGEHEQKILTLFKTQFLREADDPAWGRQTEASLIHTVTSAAFDGSQLLAADCRTTLCHVEVSHESQVAREGFIDNFPFALSFDTEVFYHRIEDEGGTPYTVMYMARAGQLPMPAQ